MKIFKKLPQVGGKVLVTGALLVAAGLPLAVATQAGAVAPAPTITSVVFSTSSSSSVADNTSGTVTITGTGFAGNGGNWSLTGADITLGGTESTSTTSLTGTFSITSAAVGSVGSLTFTDINGSNSVSVPAKVVADPNTGNVAPALLGSSQSATTETVTGTGYEAGAKVAVVDTSTGISLVVGTATVATDGGSLTVPVTPQNAVTGQAAPAGEYTLSVTNPDGGVDLGSALITVAAATVLSVSPSDIANTNGASENVTISGTGFTAAATLANMECGNGGELTWSNVTVVNSTTITATLTVATQSTGSADCNLSATYDGTNSAVLPNGIIGLGKASSVGATVTASTSTAATAVVEGGSSVLVTLTGTGFGQFTIPTFTNANGTPETELSVGAVTDTNGTSLSFSVTANSGIIAGVDSVKVNGGSSYANGLYVAGPVITAATPAAIAVGAPVGTQIALTGAGFTAAIDGTFNFGPSSLQGVIVENSATSATLTLTSAAAAGTPEVYVVVANVKSPNFKITVNAAPVAGATTNSATSVNGVGAGASNIAVEIQGSNFQSGATIGSVKTSAGAADSNVTFSNVKFVSSTELTATVSIAANETPGTDSFVVTNPDGGTATFAGLNDGLVIDAAPTVTAVSPATATAGAVNTLTITGSFNPKATVSLTSGGLCGTATYATPTSITATLTVSCAFPVAGSAGISAVVTNPDGGSATSAVLLPAAVVVTPPAVAPTNVLFAKASAKLSSTAAAALAALASQWLDGAHVTVKAYGSTHALAVARAQAVALYLGTHAAIHIKWSAVVSKSSNRVFITTTTN